ncbi:NAD(P) transhydrogenase subunit alpha [Salinirubrum litoreum]|uniref:proton-translocating NAD(P)(+) transhydrogenase n=1 Tax=Salinirubrum litoreum TaxID=1126234 RepID=A0ABD5RG86_9EURY|nr:NAD(P) transhydrogenase subunit alpha [Salinirubrum litoreum]
MIVGVPGETATDESRVALIPPVAQKLVDRGHTVTITTRAGRGADWTDEQYAAAGCDVVERRADVFDRADVVLQVRALGAVPDAPMDPYREGQTVVGLLGPYTIDDETLGVLATRRVSAFALELLPRIGRAQSMDVLTSMASVGGYKAAVMAADALPSLFPMQTTAAGTVRPADVFVVGAGVAGLQAIATARRLGARVRAYDIRPPVREEVESLGAEFLELDVEPTETPETDGYAREQGAEFYRKQREAMTAAVARADVVITAAAVPGRPAPTLVTAEMVEGMDAGSVVVDLAADSGGNCEPTRPGETVDYDGVEILGPKNLPARVSHTASQLFATNLRNFLDGLLVDEELHVDLTDEVVDATLLTHEGTVRPPARGGGPDGG